MNYEDENMPALEEDELPIDEDMPPLEEDVPPLENDILALNEEVVVIRAGYDSDYSDNSNDEEEYLEEPTTCLFCEKLFPRTDLAIAHLSNIHKVDFIELKTKFRMDQYSFIKLINCIRAERVPADMVINSEKPFWNDDKYLKSPHYEPWLCYDYDLIPTKPRTEPGTENLETLRYLIHLQREQIKEQSIVIEQYSRDLAKMRTSMQRIITADNFETGPSRDHLKCVSGVSLQSDAGYFNSYAHFGIHQEMLSDDVRTMTYRDALFKNAAFLQGKDILDVGCGTAILSIFASQAGAGKVIGIDNSDIIYNAMDIVRNNNIQNIQLIKGRLEDTELPQQKFDIIISEWMGYFLLFEGMLDSVIYARKNHLKEGGMLLPNRCTMSLVGYGNEELFKNHVKFWDNVYGLDMSNMRNDVLHEPLIEVVNPQHILTEANTIADLNLGTVELNYSDFTYNFNLKCTHDGNLSAFVGYFDTYFDLPEPVMFGTGPTDRPTHWKQVVFFIEEPQNIKAGDIINGNLICKRSNNSVRSLDIAIEVFGKKFTYYLD